MRKLTDDTLIALAQSTHTLCQNNLYRTAFTAFSNKAILPVQESAAAYCPQLHMPEQPVWKLRKVIMCWDNWQQ